MKKISLTQGKYTLVDDKDFEKLSRFNWHFSSHGYAHRHRKGGQLVGMHRIIMNTPSKMHTDHINGDKLDNRRQNLRICTQAENNRNIKKRKDNTSGFIGVSWSKASNMWRAYIHYKGKQIYIGLFSDIKKASIAYNEVAPRYHGKFCTLNPTT